jgi:hypothetical protein
MRQWEERQREAWRREVSVFRGFSGVRQLREEEEMRPRRLGWAKSPVLWKVGSGMRQREKGQKKA